MSDKDIVQMLRGWARLLNVDAALRVGMVEAADEIERLRKEHDRLVMALRNAKEGIF